MTPRRGRFDEAFFSDLWSACVLAGAFIAVVSLMCVLIFGP